MSITTCPVFHPTVQEFSCFKSYINKIKDKCKNIGICKIIPPRNWLNRSYKLEDLEKTINNVETPIQQILSGRAGVYEADLFELKSMSITDIYNYSKLNSCHINEDDDGNDDEYVIKERKFWKSIGKTNEWNHPIYGADVPGSLFDKDCLLDNELAQAWNINQLDDSILSLLEERILGVNTSYLYIGTWRAMFAFHTEVQLYTCLFYDIIIC